MGQYVNPDSRKFQLSLKSKVYVDKSLLIAKTNELFDTESRFICISRPRRFGKTMALGMLASYYGAGVDGHALFKDLNIASHSTYKDHLNQYHVVMINMQEFLSQTESVDEMIARLENKVGKEIVKLNPDVLYDEPDNLMQVFMDLYLHTKRPLVILIDEWDCLFREYKDDLTSQKIYLDFLRNLLKDKSYIGLAYMTGILPIKKYGTHSALNMFDEYSMIRPYQFLEYFGFTEVEVKALVQEYGMNFDDIQKWYNGYFIDRNNPIYNPRSVKSALIHQTFDSYWNNTETYEALKDYIKLDFDGLREKVTNLLTGADVKINSYRFSNDMSSFESADDILTLLVHLGYLTYNFEEKSVRIPNEEVKGEFINSIESLDWINVLNAVRQSDQLLQAIWSGEADTVAKGIEQVHEENTSIIAYNNENSLSCVISLALYSAKEYYTIIRELPSGKGYADLVFVPRRKHQDKPAIVVELKWDQTVEGAIHQIKEKNYISALNAYKGDLLLVGVNYEKAQKAHRCIIESFVYG